MPPKQPHGGGASPAHPPAAPAAAPAAAAAAAAAPPSTASIDDAAAEEGRASRKNSVEAPAWRRFENVFREHSLNALDPVRREGGSPRVSFTLPPGSHGHGHAHGGGGAGSLPTTPRSARVSDPQHVTHAHDHHEPRISHRAEVLVEARLDDLVHDHLVPHVSSPISPRRALLTNLWVLLLAAGILTITVVSVNRLHTSEPLENAHAVTSAEPFIMPLGNNTINYLYVVLTGAPWIGRTAGTHRPHRRRRSLLAAAIAPAPTAAAWAAPGALLTPEAAGAYVTAMPAHRVLAAAAESGGAAGAAAVPKLWVALMQRNDSAAAAAGGPTSLPVSDVAEAVVPPAALGLSPVAPPQACQMKDGAAARCLLSFQGSGLDASVYNPGAETLLVFYTDQPGQIAFEVHANELGKLGRAKNWIALAILVIMLVGIASEKVHRMYCAVLGALAMMALLLWMSMAPSLATAASWLDESTLGLLFGMMILVGQLKNTGLFEVLCAATLRACGGRMWLLSIMIMYLTALVSAFLDNVTTMLLMGPITISLMQTCNRDPRPLVMAQVLFSNIGGTATLVGDPPNIIIGTALSRHLGFVDFLVHLAPGVIAASIPALFLILGFYRSHLLGSIPSYDSCLKATSEYKILDWGLMAKSGYVVTAVVVGFLLHPIHHLDPAWYAIIGATLLCIVVAPMEVDEVMHSVEWDMLLFFGAQFIMVEAASEIGMIDMIGGWLEAAVRAAPPSARTIVAIEILLWMSAVVSGILDNIPYTITLVPVIEHLAAAGLGLELKTLAWALAFGACFGGNATLIGASANIVTATLLDKAGHRMTFLGWMRVGVPTMLVTVAAANIYMLRYAF